MKDVLLENFKRYPRTQIQDMVKLIYQSEFGCGHIIDDADSSLKRLKNEYFSLTNEASAEEAFEDIGRGLSRLNLRSVKALGISLETANGFCIGTANSVHGSIPDFERKLDGLVKLCEDGTLPFETLKVKKYIKSLRDDGYPLISHSGEYREAYSPAYRVVKNEYRNFIEIFKSIDTLKKIKENITVAIDGNCGAGKSSLANLIAGVYDCYVFHMDDFFLRPELRTPERLEVPGGNIDYERFASEIIAGIKSGATFSYRKYDCKLAELGRPVTVRPKTINIIEGSYSMHPRLIDYYDLKIFLNISEGEQKKRLKQRSVSMFERFISEWIPLEEKYFREFRIEEKSDLVYNSSKLLSDSFKTQ